MIGALTAPTGEGQAVRWLCALIAITFIARLILAATVGLGVDEAYTVATSRAWAASTYDHPPMAWWLAGGAATLFGTETPLAVRLPFILLCTVSTWLAFDAGRFLYSARAGLFAALALNLAPVLGWTSGSMVLPDGPLIAALLAGLGCVARALFGDRDRAPGWWMLAGVATGLACLSKLHGVFLLAGTGLFILTSVRHRQWLLRPWPYLATLVALAIFSPVLIWNAHHDWVSFGFQVGRSRVQRFDLAGPLIALGGQALFLLPWVWVALIISLGRVAWGGPRVARDWLLFCLAIGPIAVFTLVAITGTKTLFHWAAPGYVFACILLGRDIQRDLDVGVVATVRWVRGSIAAIALVFMAVIAIAKLPWPDILLPHGKYVPYPLIETQSWGEVRDVLAQRGLLAKPDIFVAGLKWHEAGRLDVALAGALPVRCLCADARGYGVLYDNRMMSGHDVIVITPDLRKDEFDALKQTTFQSLTRIDDIAIHHASQTVQTLQVYVGTGTLVVGGSNKRQQN